MLKSIDFKRFFISLFLISSFIGVTLVKLDTASNLFNSTQSFIANNFGWLIVLCANGFLIFCIWMAISRFGSIRLGGAGAKPEFNFINWIAMLFSAGLGIGVIFYSVAEPVSHLSSSVLFEQGASFNERATLSMNLTFLHWGFHAWAIYGVVGLCFAYFAFNLGRPFRVSSFFVDAGLENTWSRVIVDVFAILATVFGIATSLGLGASQISAGLEYLNIANSYWMPIEGLSPEASVGKFVVIIIITLLGLISVVLGLNAGIKRLSQLNMVLCGCFLMVIFLSGPTGYILDGFVENVGSYVQNFISLSTNVNAYGNSDWQNAWTLFYYCWWFAWSPFVGLFIARISYGRTIKEFILGVVLLPSLIVFIWLSVFGNAAIYQEFTAAGSLANAVSEDISVSLFVFLEQYPGATLLMGLSLINILTFFVTSSDSGALVSAMMTSSNQGDAVQRDPAIITRVVWALTLGVIAIILLMGGGLPALQTSVIATGLPFALIAFIAARNLYEKLKIDCNKKD
ncbi:MAG: BCCT family transporter [Gammaproteobacteria bacterium]|nr:glycine/betaine ABC transporter [Gammaproteobacteria bacterium]MDP6147461.1 BCCT family transporter [Gammaproteobacteria bacterium]HJL80656.1 BCCT family transporter [Gammaproteobacteria bacterium]HJN00941.1 BCCT family transporter [Gammaproteobacteria bacterium]